MYFYRESIDTKSRFRTGLLKSIAMNQDNSRELLIKTLIEKAQLKHEIFENTKRVFTEFKAVLRELSEQLQGKLPGKGRDIIIEYNERGEFEAMLRFESDILIFIMHVDVFDFDKEHNVWRSSYVNKDNNKSFCGMISVYDFLANSFKYNRDNDIGYLIARIFINNESHYFVEGKRQLGFLYNDFQNAVIDRKAVENVVNSAIMYSLDFDPLTPPYDKVIEVKVAEVKELEYLNRFITGKRLGFRFHADNDQVV